MNKSFSAKPMIYSAFIAALYVILTYVANLMGLANNPIQVRFSEALCVLPIFLPAAIPGLFIGCIISNVLTGAIFIDIIFGSLATLIGAIGTRCLRKHPLIATFPPVIANTLIIPPILAYAYHFEGSLPYFAITVGLGEIISCVIMGFIFYKILYKYKENIFR
ncbi:MAG: QueT transporter family protein [Lachnospiraceae bacterium]|nr:QueT transporter family protein [Lachnospiraceae bacterium]